MSGKKTHPELVMETLARKAIAKTIAQGEYRTVLYSNYLVETWKATGRLGCGCDARDLIAWYEINMPDELKSITKVYGKDKNHG
jgi:hypothetical protein